MTFVFAAGVSTLIIPLALGATELSRLINGDHFAVYLLMAIMMVAMGAWMALGNKLPIPMIGMKARESRGTLSVFLLGVFSGVATACCAPVLAGVVAISGVAANFLVALAVGIAYVFGMVTPLFIFALLWDGRNWGQSRIFTARTVRLGIGSKRHSLPLSSFIGGTLLIIMGVFVAFLAATGDNMSTKGWQAALSSKLQHLAHEISVYLGHLPGWMTLLFILLLFAFLARLAIHQAADDREDLDGSPEADIKNQSESDYDDMQVFSKTEGQADLTVPNPIPTTREQ